MLQSCRLSIFFSGYGKDNVRIIYPMRDENEAYYFKLKYNCYLRTGGVESRLIEEGAYNKNYRSLTQECFQKDLTKSII